MHGHTHTYTNAYIYTYIHTHNTPNRYRHAIQTLWTGKPSATVLNAASHWLTGMAHPPEPTTVKRLIPLLDRAICRVVLVADLGKARESATSFVEKIVAW